MLRTSLREKILSPILGMMLFVLGTSVACAGDNELLEQVAQRLTVFEHLEGRFKQSKHLSFMSRPIVSTGSFSLGSDHGLHWIVEHPLRSKMTVRNSTVKLDGNTVQDRGIGQFMAQVMQSFIDGDLSALARDFEASGEVTPEHWQLHLVPESILLRTVVSHLELSGNEVLQTLSIVENDSADSDAQPPTQTLIEFSAVQGTHGAVRVQGPAGL